MFSQDLLRKSHQVLNTTRSLHRATRNNHGQNNSQNRERGIRHGRLKDKCKDKRADRTGKRKENSSLANAPEDEKEQDDKLNPEHDFFSFFFDFSQRPHTQQVHDAFFACRPGPVSVSFHQKDAHILCYKQSIPICLCIRYRNVMLCIVMQ